MHIKTLKLQNFRNYEDARFVLDPAVNLICGENGQGKTNLLEAAAACSTMRLFRTAQKIPYRQLLHTRRPYGND